MVAHCIHDGGQLQCGGTEQCPRLFITRARGLRLRRGQRGAEGVVVVDEDIEPADLNDVIFAITTRCNPVEDMDVIRGIPGLMLDPRIAPERRAVGDSTTSTMIINACRPWSMRNSYPRVNIVSKALRDEALAKWGDILKLEPIRG